ncbi:galactose-1-phosphate uridylyltransferase [Bacilli bacterium]|nr:galactose-1-phosphate uridylyltransferase [Bacilli bacterium]GHU40841.1 galactose-1-phosphate uridylyltransferase [Bacilli bacterium]GHU45136.1 galactose-1-phosphate uridylyltransferase [Bacilli bacterium]
MHLLELEVEMSIYQTIQNFVELAIKNGAIEAMDSVYLRNQLLHFLGMNDWEQPEATQTESDALTLMDQLLSAAHENQQFDTIDAACYEAALMDFVTPNPSQINRQFWQKYRENPDCATDYFYTLAREINQVKTRDIAKNIAFKHATQYGDLEITINLSKPEKDPKMIAAAKAQATTSYPKCLLCLENEGLYGGGNHPARSNHRFIRLALNQANWGFQYSPYAYYPEHAIIFHEKHQMMKMNRLAFENLLEFLDVFPHYMIGSNADLPIVGGSILTHDHYQAGKYRFPMMKAAIRQDIQLKKYPEIKAGLVNWPMSVLRLQSRNKEELLTASAEILEKWQHYSDVPLQIIALTADGVQHHTVTPIARKEGETYILDLVFRDNNTSEAFPDGIFHPHPALQHIKKENIGLIEVMGLAILPPRLKAELKEVERYLLGQPNQIDKSHLPWAEELKKTTQVTEADVQYQVQQAVGEVFEKVLQDAGVFKDDAQGKLGFDRFIDFINEVDCV